MAQGLTGFNVTEEDHLRAQWYGLLARLLSAPPDRDLLETVCGLEGDDSELGRGIRPETRPSELPSPDESELQTAALSKEPNLVEPRVRGPVKSTRNAKGAASRRRWGTQKKPS